MIDVMLMAMTNLFLTSVTAQHESNQNQIFKMDSSRFGRSKEESINQVVLEDPLQLFQLLLGMSRTFLRTKICQNRTQFSSHSHQKVRIISAIHRAILIYRNTFHQQILY